MTTYLRHTPPILTHLKSYSAAKSREASRRSSLRRLPQDVKSCEDAPPRFLKPSPAPTARSGGRAVQIHNAGRLDASSAGWPRASASAPASLHRECVVDALVRRIRTQRIAGRKANEDFYLFFRPPHRGDLRMVGRFTVTLATAQSYIPKRSLPQHAAACVYTHCTDIASLTSQAAQTRCCIGISRDIFASLDTPMQFASCTGGAIHPHASASLF